MPSEIPDFSEANVGGLVYRCLALQLRGRVTLKEFERAVGNTMGFRDRWRRCSVGVANGKANAWKSLQEAEYVALYKFVNKELAERPLPPKLMDNIDLVIGDSTYHSLTSFMGRSSSYTTQLRDWVCGEYSVYRYSAQNGAQKPIAAGSLKIEFSERTQAITTFEEYQLRASYCLHGYLFAQDRDSYRIFSRHSTQGESDGAQAMLLNYIRSLTNEKTCLLAVPRGRMGDRSAA